ncbi:hypothetical protein BH09VER1_BH09VER1_24680 [soil metagenome]
MNNDRLSNFNPLRGLDLTGLVNYFEMGQRGFYADLMWLYRMVLRRNSAARAVRRKLTSAIGKLDWDIKIPEGLEGQRLALAEQQKAELRQAFDRLKNFRATLRHLAFADIMEFSHCEKIYQGGRAADAWNVVELRVVPQWYMCREGMFAPWAYNEQAMNTNRGPLIDPAHWIIRQVDDPAAEIFSVAHLKMSTTDADWDQFCDTYAVNPIFIEMPPNVPKEKIDEYQRVAEEIVSDGRGALPNGATVHTVTPGTGGESVFTERLRYYREEIVIAGTGGILTTLDGNTGLGKGPADSHDEAWLDIAAEIGANVSEALQDQFCTPLLQRKFKDQELLAYFELAKPEHAQDSSSVLGDAKTASEAGYRIDADELSEKSGYTLTVAETPLPPQKQETGGAPAEPVAAAPGETTPAVAKPAEVPTPPLADPAKESPAASAAGEAKPSLVQAALAEDLDLESRWLAPVGDIFAEIQTMLADQTVPLEDVVAKIEIAARSMPELLGKLNVDELARALENATGPAALEGLVDGLRAKTKKSATQVA